jgi:DNA repair protein RadD
LYVAPTGSGKTVLFTNLVDGTMRNGKRCIIIAHRIEIVEQVSTALAGLGVPHGVIAPGYAETPEPVQVASVASLVRRLDRHDHYDLIVIDEAHHSVAGTWRRVIDAMPGAKVLGCSATPERLDGCGLGNIFDELVTGPTTAELIEAGYLSKFTAYAPVEAPDMTGISTRAGDFAVDELAGIMARPVTSALRSKATRSSVRASGRSSTASTGAIASCWSNASSNAATEPCILMAIRERTSGER